MTTLSKKSNRKTGKSRKEDISNLPAISKAKTPGLKILERIFPDQAPITMEKRITGIKEPTTSSLPTSDDYNVFIHSIISNLERVILIKISAFIPV